MGDSLKSSLKIFILFKLCLIGLNQSYAKLIKFTVATSIRDPFGVDIQKSKFNSLDVEILLNFGRKLNATIEFIKTDVALDEVFSSTEFLNDFDKEFNIS